MLAALTIVDIVLIDRLHVEFGDGLTVLTGETGAGKSIILDALGLALGARGDGSLVKEGAKEGSVTASFDLEPGSHVETLLGRANIETGDGVIIRRVQGADGRTRAFINDQPVSVQLLREVGAACVEIHGQHDDRALLEREAHRALLDAFGGLGGDAREVEKAWAKMAQAEEALNEHVAVLEQARREEDYLRHSVNELEQLAPEPGEEQRLADARQLMMHAEKFTVDLDEVYEVLSGDNVAEVRLAAALRKLERNRDKAQGRFDAVISALESAVAELGEARHAVAQGLREIEFDPAELERIEERLFALKAAARKYATQVDALPAVAAELADKLSALEHDEARRRELETRLEEARTLYFEKARALSEKRVAAATTLDAMVMVELAPLKLEKARFVTDISPLGDGGPSGLDQVEFAVAANPGQTPGPLMKVASGGELARFILGLKVVLAEKGSAPTLIFDEIDTGAGGAVADAIGVRLAKLGEKLQVIAVTHSPQVAAQARTHWRVTKREDGSGDERRAVSEIDVLDERGREEEVARMLAGAEITSEARAAAARLIGER